MNIKIILTSDLTSSSFRGKKTKKGGAASVVYSLPGTHKATRNYVKLYRAGASRDQPVFVNSLGNKVKPAMPHKFLKEKILAKMNVLTASQLAKFFSKAWRKVLLSHILAIFVTKLSLSNDKSRNILKVFIQHCTM